MDYENNWRGINGRANAGLITGIIGTTGVAASLAANALGLGNNGCGGHHAPNSDSMPVNRYELALEQANAAKDAEISLLKATIYGDQKGLEIYKVLQDNDAYTALGQVGGLVFTGPTGTNVNDVAVALYYAGE